MVNEHGLEVDREIVSIAVDAGVVYGLTNDGNIYMWSPVDIKWSLYKANEIKQKADPGVSH